MTIFNPLPTLPDFGPFVHNERNQKLIAEHRTLALVQIVGRVTAVVSAILFVTHFSLSTFLLAAVATIGANSIYKALLSKYLLLRDAPPAPAH